MIYFIPVYFTPSRVFTYVTAKRSLFLVDFPSDRWTWVTRPAALISFHSILYSTYLALELKQVQANTYGIPSINAHHHRYLAK
jgi:hypothetical protein